MNNLVEKFLYNRKEAALSLGVSIRSVDYIISRRDLETRRVGKKVWSPTGTPSPLRPALSPQTNLTSG